MEVHDPNKTEQLTKIKSLPNLRVLCKHSLQQESSAQCHGAAAIYRSSKPDRLISDELDKFRKLGIKCIVDFRSKTEYMGSDGHRLLDKEYPVFSVKIINNGKKNKGDVHYEYKRLLGATSEQMLVALATDEPSSDSGGAHENESSSVVRNRFDQVSPKQHGKDNVGVSNPTKQWQTYEEVGAMERKHFLINFFPFKFIFSLLFTLPWHLILMGFMLLFLDVIRRNKFKGFTKFFIQEAVNCKGIIGQYIDIAEGCQPSICAALKLVSDPNNLPVLINCAHGKDRTGIVSAMILSCLEMPKEYVAEEYALSNEGLAPIHHLVYRDIVEKYEFREEFCYSEAATMLKLLTYLENKYGSIQNYMVHIGFSLEDQKQLRDMVDAYDQREVGRCKGTTCRAPESGEGVSAVEGGSSVARGSDSVAEEAVSTVGGEGSSSLAGEE
ncbi:uncharacterized protein LOC101846784 [Aplysia californica]|uniref:Uncharacterized protein LOC101846784 n=1 Tax=Aplysia californica TaxID=6500 RepID=A0ABM1W3S1_APLCA|nr:uncharacterized protein LOC101846784 [Aplysia californica]